VDDRAEIGEGVLIGPYAVIGPGVRLGAACRVGAHAVLEGDTWLGESCEVFPHAVLGTVPQDKKLPAGSTGGPLRIGSHNVFREHVTIQGGTPHGVGVTSLGDDNLFLAGSHVGHDARIDSHVVFTNGAMAAGHSTVGDYVILGAMVGIHQFARVGQRAMVGAGAMLSHDAPPFSLIQGDRARLVGVNAVGLRRAQYDQDAVATLKKAFRMLFWRPGTLEARVRNTQALAGHHEMVREVLDFVQQSRRGVCMPRSIRPPAPEDAHELDG
jgi:UDP-N-acetylglucosamine acyltransferase